MKTRVKQDRLWLPVSTTPYRHFTTGAKTFELRNCRPPYTARTVREGRRVEIGRGYSTPDRLWGTIVSVHRAMTLEAMFRMIEWRSVIPWATSWGEACEIAASYVDPTRGDGLIAFRIQVDGVSTVPTKAAPVTDTEKIQRWRAALAAAKRRAGGAA